MFTTSTTGLSGLRPLPAGLIRTSLVSQVKLHNYCRQRRQLTTQAQLGGSGEDNKKTNFRDKGFISAEEEPDEFFITKAESKGGLAPLKDPIAIVGILGILLPFVILGIAIATGYVDVSPRASLGR